MALTNKYVSTSGAGTHDGSSEANAMTWAEMVTAINAGGTAGNRYNVKANATYSFVADVTITGSGSSTSPTIIRGYTTTIGDARLARTNGNGPMATTNMPALSFSSGFRLNASGAFLLFESLNITGTFAGGLLNTALDQVVFACKSTNASTSGSASAVALGGRSAAIDCDLSLTGASGGLAALNISTNGGRAIANRIKGGPSTGVVAAANTSLLGNIIYRGTNGVAMNNTGGSPTIAFNTIVLNSADGINIVTGTTVIENVFGNLITDNTGYGINGVSAANAIVAAYNRLDRNTAGATNLATDWLAATSYGHNLTSVTQAQEYVDAAADDYRLQSTSPALGAGWFPYMDIGALQRVAAAAGGGGSPNLDGGVSQ